MRRLGLTAHVVASVGWLGAVAAFLAVAVAGFRTHDDDIARSAYVSMQLTAWWVIAPLSVLSFITGLVQALSTPWGLFRHYWVVVKLLINLAATGILMLHMRAIDFMAGQATSPSFATHDHLPIRLQIGMDAAAALVALIAATALSVFKPKGLTRYGWRQQVSASGSASQPSPPPRRPPSTPSTTAARV